MRTDGLHTPYGSARLHHLPVEDARAVLLLGHSAGGGVDDPALLAAAKGAATQRVSTVLLEQPYRVLPGRRPPAPAAQVDAVLLAALAHLGVGAAQPVVTGGRSFGGRVACRTSLVEGGDVRGVLCLAFPLLSPGAAPERSRLPELDAVTVPVLVVQGSRDPFGIPPATDGRELVLVPGDHSLRRSLPQVSDAVGRWLGTLLDG